MSLTWLGPLALGLFIFGLLGLWLAVINWAWKRSLSRWFK